MTMGEGLEQVLETNRQVTARYEAQIKAMADLLDAAPVFMCCPDWGSKGDGTYGPCGVCENCRAVERYEDWRYHVAQTAKQKEAGDGRDGGGGPGVRRGVGGGDGGGTGGAVGTAAAVKEADGGIQS